MLSPECENYSKMSSFISILLLNIIRLVVTVSIHWIKNSRYSSLIDTFSLVPETRIHMSPWCCLFLVNCSSMVLLPRFIKLYLKLTLVLTMPLIRGWFIYFFNNWHCLILYTTYMLDAWWAILYITWSLVDSSIHLPLGMTIILWTHFFPLVFKESERRTSIW